MRALLQRVTRAQATPAGVSTESLGGIGRGMLILVGFEATDTPLILEQLAQKIGNLRVFSDENGKMNLSGAQVGAQYLVVSQFTLYAQCRHGNRPSFDKAGPKTQAQGLYDQFVAVAQRLWGKGVVLHTPFGSDLQIELVNDGPVTLWLDSQEVL